MKKVVLDSKAQEGLVDGINMVANAVGSTLGPGGRLVAIRNNMGPVIVTKDGVTVARSFSLDDPIKETGVRLCIQVSSTTNQTCGDGTTTATVLSQIMVNDGLRYVQNGGGRTGLVYGISLAAKEVEELLDELKKPITQGDLSGLRFVANVAGNDEAVGELVAQAFYQVGLEGTVSIEPSKTYKDSLDIIDGYRFDRGINQLLFATNPQKLCLDLENVPVLVWERKILRPQELQKFANNLIRNDKTSLIIVTDDFSQEIEAALIRNKLENGLNFIAIKAPGFGERRKALLQDTAAVTGAKFFPEEACTSMDNIRLEDLGVARRWISTLDQTTVIPAEENADKISAHIETLRSQKENAESDRERSLLEERIAKLLGKVAIIRVGASTESELTERYARFEDAVNATKVALEEGIVPGGGLALAICHKRMKSKSNHRDVQAGIDLVRRAILRPMHLIAENAGYSGDFVVQKVLEGGAKKGFDASTGRYVDMMSVGIVDPVKVTKTALRNAVSIANLVINTNCVIAEENNDGK